MGKEKLFLNYHQIGALHKGENIHTLVLQTSKTYNKLYGAKGDNTSILCFVFSLLTLVKKWKLKWSGHVSRSSASTKTILQGIVKGKRRRGRQKEIKEDNIKKSTGMDGQ